MVKRARGWVFKNMGLFDAIGRLIGMPIQYGLNQADKKRTYMLNEQAAQQADARTRKLYNDIQSPIAQITNLKAAGLNPALIYADGAGGIGQTTSGAQASGVSNNSYDIPNLNPLDDMMKIEQIKNIKANTNKTNEETNSEKLKQFGLEYDNSIKMLETQIKASTIDEQIETIKNTAKDIENKAKLSGIQADIAEETKETEIERAKQEVNKIISELNLNEEQKNEIIENVNRLKRLSFGYVQGMLETILGKFVDDKEKVENLASGLTTILLIAAQRK